MTSVGTTAGTKRASPTVKSDAKSIPYIKKRKYDFGTSSLDHNPIVNPENNYNYNKYINYQSFAAGLNSLNNSRNNNKVYKIKRLNNLDNNDNIH